MISEEVEVANWEGSAGLGRLRAFGVIASSDPASFEGVSRTLAVDGIRLAEFHLSAATYSARAARPPSEITLVWVRDGSCSYALDGPPHDAPIGTTHAVLIGGQMRVDVLERSRFTTATIPLRMLRPDVWSSLAALAGPVASSGASDALLILIGQVLDLEVGGRASPAAAPLQALAVAAVECILPAEQVPSLREHFLAYIERHLTDHSLGPQAIADAFGISLRWTHAVFGAGGTTIAHHIRDQRLQLVAAAVSDARHVPVIGVLAARYGFNSRDHLARAFRAKFGMSLIEYAAQCQNCERDPDAIA